MYIFYSDNFSGGRAKSRVLLRAALKKYYGTSEGIMYDVLAGPSDEYMIEETELGKPFIEGGPDFSVSHSDSYWAVLIDQKSCGIDIQAPKQAKYYEIASRYFSEREADLVDLLGGDFFFKIWTRREALIKCAGKSVISSDVPELMIPPDSDAIKLYYDGGYRAIMDLDLQIDLYISICTSVDEEWTAKREVPKLRRLDI